MPLLLLVMEYKGSTGVLCQHIKPPSANQPCLFVTEKSDEEEGRNSFCEPDKDGAPESRSQPRVKESGKMGVWVIFVRNPRTAKSVKSMCAHSRCICSDMEGNL